jgi:hypothetical protein
MPVATRTTAVTVVALLLVLSGTSAANALFGGVPVSVADSGDAVAFGRNTSGQANVPALPTGVTYTAASAGEMHTVLLRSDGQAIAFGYGNDGQLAIPALPAGTTYTAVSTGYLHTVLLRSDGQAIAFGYNVQGQTNVPPLPTGLTYTGVAAGFYNTLLLRSDGELIAFGDSTRGHSDVQPLPTGLTYTAGESTYHHLIMLRSDGTVATTGENTEGQLNVPALPTGTTWADISANAATTLLVRSDGQAFAFGRNNVGQAVVPALPAGVSYVDGDVGENHSLLLRSDGRVVAFGGTASGQTTVPPLPAGTEYTAVSAGTELSVLIRSAIETTTTVSSPASTAPGAIVTFSATVTPATVTGADFAGTVRFTFDDASTEDVAIGTDGTATVDRAAPATGSLTAAAEYLGGGYAPSAVSALATTAVVVPDPVTIEITVTGGAASVEQGGSLTFEVTGEDAGGALVAVDLADITLTSSVPTDQIAGLVVVFPHASPHTITARFRASGPTSAVTIDVIPTAAGGGAASRSEVLGNTGHELTGELASAATLLALGAALLLVVSRRRRSGRA